MRQFDTVKDRSVGKKHLFVTSASSGNGGDKMTVAVSGGTGFIGTRLVERLLQEGHTVRVVTRSVVNAKYVFRGKGVPDSSNARLSFLAPSDWSRAVEGCTGVVNLAGTPISTRWTSEVKADIKRSRIDVTKKIVDAIKKSAEESRPKVFISSSALGFYGTSETKSFDEGSPSGNDYLAEVCREWEAEASKAAGVRLLFLRTGIVLDKDGGALAKMLPIFKLYAGGPLGSGKQWFSWVHRDDLVSLIIEGLKNPSFEGVVNGTAPNPVRFSEMCSQLGGVLGRPSWLPVPDFAVKALLGDGAYVVLDGQKVLPKRAQELGFSFKYRFIADALSAILT